jgi:beta-glucanase (GH16 family)
MEGATPPFIFSLLFSDKQKNSFSKKYLMKKNNTVVFYFVCVMCFLVACSKGKDATPTPIEPPAASLPSLSVLDVSQPRRTIASTMRFNIYANKTSTSAMMVDYTVVNGSALAGTDYTATSGTATIPANQNLATIDVTINGNANNLRQNNLEFKVQLNNPKFCTISTPSITGTIVTEDGIYLPTDNTGYTTPLTYTGYTLTWADEFSGSVLDATAWNQETGNNNGWGNNELQNYTNSLKNTFLSNGNLIIEARKEQSGGVNYSSARLTTQNKKNFKFGRIDIRAKLPVDKGMWPALWMLGSNINTVGWPQCGEIDIMELVGLNNNKVYSTMHWKNTAGTRSSNGSAYTLPSGNFSQQFHVFSLIWTQDLIKTYVDDVLYATTSISNVSPAAYPFNANQFFLFNIAVGGDWPGAPDASTNFPQRMFVDYVRVFQ